MHFLKSQKGSDIYYSLLYQRLRVEKMVADDKESMEETGIIGKYQIE